MKLVKRLLAEKSTLVVPGQHFQMGRYLRIGYGGTRALGSWLTPY
jgi:aspartate/methionine/tyrosine aminotransferase